MHDAGVGLKEIGLVFGISAEGVRAVLKKLQAEEKAIQRSAELLKDFRLADDLDRKWTVEEMMDALHLSTRLRTAIGCRCEWKKVGEMTLREFMDLVLPDKPHAKPGYLITHLLDLRNVRLHSFWLTVKRLSELDLGMQCNLEWKRRWGRLIRASRIVGGRPLSWSKACEPPDWLRAQITI